MSAVLCLPACLCVSPQRPVARPPNGNASKAFHRRGVTQPPCATRGLQGVRAAPQPREPQDHHGARSAAQSIAPSDHGSAATVKEVDRPGLPHQRVPSADRQGSTPSFTSRVTQLHNHSGATASTTTTKDFKTKYAPRCHGKLARSGQDVAAAPPPCGAPTAEAVPRTYGPWPGGL